MMGKRGLLNFRFVLFTSGLLLLVMFTLPSYSVDTYSIIKNTTSHLGAQNSTNAWVMNLTFMLVGVSCLLEAWLHMKEFWFQKILLSVFGLGLVLTGLFRHAPIIKGVSFNPVEDNLHSIFASIVGFSFTVYAISSAFIEKESKHKVMDIMVGVTVTVLSLLMGYLPDYSGVWQRAIFVISFTWLVFMLERTRFFNQTV